MATIMPMQTVAWSSTEQYAIKTMYSLPSDKAFFACPVVTNLDVTYIATDINNQPTKGTAPASDSAWTVYGTSQSITTTGVFEPAITCTTVGDLAITYSSQNGYYSITGNLVQVNITLITSAFTHTTAAGVLEITGLPFPSASGTANDIIGSVVFQGITKAGYTQFSSFVAPGSETIYLKASASAEVVDFVDITDLPTAGNVVLQISFTYTTS
jgi:hypothetical protein